MKLKYFLSLAAFALMALVLVPHRKVEWITPSQAQERSNTFFVSEFQAPDVGTKVTKAQASCSANTSIPCVIVIDAIMAVWPQGSMPGRCANCIWLDYRGVTFSAAPFSLGAVGSVTDLSANPALSGFVRTGNNVCAVSSRNVSNTGDICDIQLTAANAVAIGGAGGISINGGGALTAQSGSGSSIVTNIGPSITTPTVISPTINTGLTQGSGAKHQRFGASCTTAAAVGAACTSAYTWTVTFADASYTVGCFGTLASGSPILTYSAKTATQISIGVAAGSAAAAQFAAVDCIAFHD
jgi:hypothetical protein